MKRPTEFCLDWGVVTGLPDKEGMDVLSQKLIYEAKKSLRGYPGATLKNETLRIVWEKEGNRHLYGYVGVDWGFGGNPPPGQVAPDGRPMRG